jgi:hypothetical protein
MIARVLALAAALMLATAVTAHAQDEDEEEEEFYYAKESSGYLELAAATGDIDGDTTGGVSAIIGGHLETWLAMEGQYQFLEDESTHLASYSLKFVPLQGRIQPYVKAGIGLMGGRPDHTYLFLGRFAAGASFFLNEQMALTAGLTAAIAAHGNNAYLGSIGFAYYLE